MMMLIGIFYPVSLTSQRRGIRRLTMPYEPHDSTSSRELDALEDVLHLFGLPIDGEVVTGWTDSSHDFLGTQSLAIFGSEPQVSSSSKSYINLSWASLSSVTDKSTSYAHAKYLPLLQNFDQIGNYSWGQLVSRTFIGHCVMHHGTIVRRWMSHLICYLLGYGSVCRDWRPFPHTSLRRLRYRWHAGLIGPK
ncbi:hypothetical protein AHAS_Ahas18G0126500 [Arachis hypogaea]